MANNYLQFSEEVPGLSEVEDAWVHHVLDDVDEDDPVAKDPDRTALHERIEKEVGDADMFPDFCWAVDGENNNLWLYAEESGSVEQLARFVQEFLRKFRPNSCFTINWAATCDRPRVGAFCGGAVFITAKDMKFMNADEWAHEQVTAFEVRSKKAKKGKK